MDSLIFTPRQEQVITAPPSGSIFAAGSPGSGKTTAAVARLRAMIEGDIPAESILILVPQRSLALPYYREISRPDLRAGGLPTIITMGGLAQRTLQLFWPAISNSAGFKHPNLPPTFLTLETAQYYMAKVVQPLFSKGYFDQLVVNPNRLYSQLLDNLNKAAVVGFSHEQIAQRLKDAWIGKPGHLIHYDHAQECINLFREYCLEKNLLDYSLQIEVFAQNLWPSHLIHQYLTNQYRHLIYDNVEEDVPVTHDIIREWLPSFDSALLLLDEGAGYRAFLGADPDNGSLLREECDQIVSLDESLVSSPEMHHLSVVLESLLTNSPLPAIPASIKPAFTPINVRFYPEMIDTVASEIAHLIQEQGYLPSDIAVVSPFLSDSLRHALTNRLNGLAIPTRTSRPSRSLLDEPAARCLLALIRLAHPQWKHPVSQAEGRSMLLQTIGGLDLIRADLISRQLFNQKIAPLPLTSFDELKPEIQERISYSVGERYMRLLNWLRSYLEDSPVELDIFLAKIFGEILSQPGFAFHENYDAAAVTARMIESIQKFRRVAGPALSQSATLVGQEYLQMVLEGVISALYLPSASHPPENAVFIAPAYSFLISNEPVKIQFWLDVGSLGWWERLYQPLTHPHVLSRRWNSDRKWSDVDDVAANRQTLSRLVTGLIARCGEHVYLCSAKINERGSEEKGPLLQTVQVILRRSRGMADNHV